jgi:hypothetical protein
VAGRAWDPDAALEHHEASLTALRTAVAEIEQSPSFLMLTNADGHTRTAERFATVTAEAADLWPLLEAAAGMVEAARDHRTDKGTTGAAGLELRRLLQDRWFTVPGGTGAAQSRSAHSISSLLDEIRRRYEAIREAVSIIDGVWLDLPPRIEAARATLDRLQADATELGVVEPLIGRARALAEDLSERLVSDPAALSLADGVELDRQVGEAAKHMSSLRVGHDELGTDLARAEELLAGLRVLLARARAAGVEAERKIVDPAGLVRLPADAILDGPDGLGARLDRVVDAGVDPTWTRQRALLDAWMDTASGLERQLTAAEERNRAPVADRNELRGRLKAFQAKMAGIGRAEDLELTELFDQARSLLYVAPTDLGRAEAAITELAARLRS